MNEKIYRFGAFIALVAIVAILSLTAGCSWFEDDGPTTVTIQGSPGSECTYDWECQSNACIYPGRCQ